MFKFTVSLPKIHLCFHVLQMAPPWILSKPLLIKYSCTESICHFSILQQIYVEDREPYTVPKWYNLRFRRNKTPPGCIRDVENISKWKEGSKYHRRNLQISSIKYRDLILWLVLQSSSQGLTVVHADLEFPRFLPLLVSAETTGAQHRLLQGLLYVMTT